MVASYQLLNFVIPELESPEFCMNKMYGRSEKLEFDQPRNSKDFSGKGLRLHQSSGRWRVRRQWTAAVRL